MEHFFSVILIATEAVTILGYDRMLILPLNFISKHTEAFGVKLSLACFMLFDIVFMSVVTILQTHASLSTSKLYDKQVRFRNACILSATALQLPSRRRISLSGKSPCEYAKQSQFVPKFY